MMLKTRKSGPVWRLVQLLLGGAIFFLLWFIGHRLTSPWRTLEMIEIESVPRPEDRPHATASSHSPTAIRVAAFNIAHGRGGAFGASNWQRRSDAELRDHLGRIADQIKRSGADFVVLNEVDFRSKWSRHFNQARFIAERAGYRYLVEQRNIDVAIPGFSLAFGNALLSRHSIEEVERIAFPPLSRWQKIVAGNHDGFLAKVRTPVGTVAVAGVHLEVRSEKTRYQAARRLAELRDRVSEPFVALGDFNSTPSGFPEKRVSAEGKNALDFLVSEAGFQSDAAMAPESEYFTFPSEAPRVTIDWILAGQGLEVSGLEVVRSELSDHLMIKALLTRSSI